MPSLGQEVRARRRCVGLTLAALADRAGCTKGYLSSIETGKRERPPSAGLLEKLERALGMKSGALVELGRWERTPAEIRELVLGLESRAADGARLAALVVEAGRNGGGVCGELAALAGRMAGDGGLGGMATGVRPVAVRVTGGEMEPVYCDGDVVFFVEDGERVVDGTDCVVRLREGGRRVFRRVFFEGGGVRLQPVNCAFAAEVVGSGEVEGMARAVWVVRRVGDGGWDPEIGIPGLCGVIGRRVPAVGRRSGRR